MIRLATATALLLGGCGISRSDPPGQLAPATTRQVTLHVPDMCKRLNLL